MRDRLTEIEAREAGARASHERLFATEPDTDAANDALMAYVRDMHASALDVPWLVAQVRERDARADAAEKATREAFVAGAKWWEFVSTGGTMWGADQHRAHAEAERRFPHAPAPWEIALQKEIDERDAEIARLRAEVAVANDARVTIRDCFHCLKCDACLRRLGADPEAPDA